MSAHPPLAPGLPPGFRTARLLLACWRPEDAPLLKEAVDTSLDHLRPWMPWALEEPSPVERLAERLRGFRDAYLAGRDFPFGIFTPDRARVLGGAGLHRRRGPRALEIGYWVRSGETGRGLATEAAAVLTRAALEMGGAEWTEIRCAPANAASAAVPRRLGYRLATRLVANATTPAGEPRDTLVWQMRRGRAAASPVSRFGFEALDAHGGVPGRFQASGGG